MDSVPRGHGVRPALRLALTQCAKLARLQVSPAPGLSGRPWVPGRPEGPCPPPREDEEPGRLGSASSVVRQRREQSCSARGPLSAAAQRVPRGWLIFPRIAAGSFLLWPREALVRGAASDAGGKARVKKQKGEREGVKIQT